MRRTTPPTVTCLFVFLAIALARPAAAQFDGLVHFIPYDANAMLLIDVDELMASPMAKQENWRADLEQAFSAGLVILPPQSSRVLFASRLDFQLLQPRWS